MSVPDEIGRLLELVDGEEGGLDGLWGYLGGGLSEVVLVGL